MNLTKIREHEKARPGRIHQALPSADSSTSAASRPAEGCRNETCSYFCCVGPQTRHHLCQATWCKCRCHDNFEYMYGME